ncbi:MAG: galactose oxidase [Bacteroidota bacterium]
MSRFLFFASLLVLIVACAPTGEPNPGGTWSSIVAADASKPVKRHEAAFVKVGEKFVLLGGRGIRPVSIYDTQTQSWSEGAAPPVEIHHFQPVVLGEKVLIMGAFNGGYPDETPLPVIYQYDLASDRWSIGDSIPADRRRGAAGVVVFQDKVYLVSGIQNGHMSGHVPWLDEYDPATDTWSQLPDAPRSRDHFQAIVMENQMYLLGGRRSNAPDSVFANPVGEVDVYDFASQSWRTIAEPLPTLRAGNFVTSIGEEILVLGGESEFQELAHNEVEALHTQQETWRSLSPMLQGRHGTGAVWHRGHLFVASGCGNRGGSQELETMEAYEPY